MEELLTDNEIAIVLAEASKPNYRVDDYYFTFSKLDIAKVSNKGLIFIHGNDHTGMEHIGLRHSVTSRKLFEKDGQFDNPTKFNLAPVEYPFVADTIYDPSNINDKKNKRPDTFEIYEGDYDHRDGSVFKYTLILYKATKIVHTFFLSNNSKPFNKKIKLPIRQGWTGGKHELLSGLQEFSINYMDLSDIVRFSILLRCLPDVGLEKWYLTVYDTSGSSIFTHFLYEELIVHNIAVPFRMGILDFQDLSSIDRILERIIQGAYEFEKNFNQFCGYQYGELGN